MIAILDYGVGNLFSLASSLRFLGLETRLCRQAEELEQAERIILPGVGAFGDAARKLQERGLAAALQAQAAAGKPLLGICLGMQLLFERSYEFGLHPGLGLIPGEVRPLAERLPPGLKVPHIGWNSLELWKPEDPLLKYSRQGDYMYYVHSYYATGCAESTLASSSYGLQVPGLVRRGSVCGTQFHPEKSGEAGLRLLQAFAEWEVDA